MQVNYDNIMFTSGIHGVCTWYDLVLIILCTTELLGELLKDSYRSATFFNLNNIEFKYIKITLNNLAKY